jgi:hypothetical protein
VGNNLFLAIRILEFRSKTGANVRAKVDSDSVIKNRTRNSTEVILSTPGEAIDGRVCAAINSGRASRKKPPINPMRDTNDSALEILLKSSSNSNENQRDLTPSAYRRDIIQTNAKRDMKLKFVCREMF